MIYPSCNRHSLPRLEVGTWVGYPCSNLAPKKKLVISVPIGSIYKSWYLGENDKKSRIIQNIKSKLFICDFPTLFFKTYCFFRFKRKARSLGFISIFAKSAHAPKLGRTWRVDFPQKPWIKIFDIFPKINLAFQLFLRFYYIFVDFPGFLRFLKLLLDFAAFSYSYCFLTSFVIFKTFS